MKSDVSACPVVDDSPPESAIVVTPASLVGSTVEAVSDDVEEVSSPAAVDASPDPVPDPAGVSTVGPQPTTRGAMIENLMKVI